jgi:hypothetical protein
MFFLIIATLPLNVTNPILSLFLNFFAYVPLIPVVPRFIIGIRELYDKDSRRGCIQEIDTGFGMFSQAFVSRGTIAPAIAFADNAPVQDQSMSMEEYAGESDVIRIERFGDDAAGGQV